jgi:hypothetical protein
MISINQRGDTADYVRDAGVSASGFAEAVQYFTAGLSGLSAGWYYSKLMNSDGPLIAIQLCLCCRT